MELIPKAARISEQHQLLFRTLSSTLEEPVPRLLHDTRSIRKGANKSALVSSRAGMNTWVCSVDGTEYNNPTYKVTAHNLSK